MKSESKPCTAIIIPGGIGTGRNNIGVPVLERIIKLLSHDFDLTVFQLYRLNENFKVDGFDLIEIHSDYAFLRSIKFFYLFFKTQRLKQFKCVHGFWSMPCGFFAVLVGKFFKIKSVVSVLGGDAISLPEIGYGQLRNPFYRVLILWTLTQANEVNALTHYLCGNLKKAGITRQGIKIIPWGIDTTLFAFREKPMSGQVQFLHIANLHPVKDQDTLLRAFKIIAETISAHLTIIGEGVSENQVKSRIAQLNLQDAVTLISSVPYEELPAHYHRADILLHTSLSEGQSEVVTEAMSCGVLVCGTKVGLLHDLPDCCVSVPVRDYEALAKETLQLISAPELRKAIRDRAHEWTAEHSIGWTVERIKECYQL